MWAGGSFRPETLSSLAEPSLKILLHRKLGTSLTAAQCAAIISPFLAFQWVAYRDFCLVAAEAVMDSSSAQRRPWCEARIPLMYGWVQEHYW